MELSLPTSTVSCFNPEHRFAGRPPKLSTSTSLRFSRLWGLSLGDRQSLSFKRPRRILLRVEAKKQTFSSFDDMLANSEKPLLVDFYATWCGPCQFMGPVLNQVGDSLKEKIQVVKIDTEKYPSIAYKYRIEALPTFILFKEGKICDRFEGALTADQLIQRIENALKVGDLGWIYLMKSQVPEEVVDEILFNTNEIHQNSSRYSASFFNLETVQFIMSISSIN